jgi:hypothetical protein
MSRSLGVVEFRREIRSVCQRKASSVCGTITASLSAETNLALRGWFQRVAKLLKNLMSGIAG